MLTELVPCGNPLIIKTIDHPGRSLSKDWLKAIPRDGKLFCGWCNQKELPATRKKYCSDDCAESSTAYCNPSTHLLAFHILLTRQDGKCAHCQHSYDDAIEFARREILKWKRRHIISVIRTLKKFPEWVKGIERAIEKYNLGLCSYYTFHANGGISYYDSKKNPAIELQNLNEWHQKEKTELSMLLKEYFEQRKTGHVWRVNTPNLIRAYHRSRKDDKEPETDHIIPIALGGMAIGLDNVQILCYRCHKIKSKTDLAEIRASRRGAS